MPARAGGDRVALGLGDETQPAGRRGLDDRHPVPERVGAVIGRPSGSLTADRGARPPSAGARASQRALAAVGDRAQVDRVPAPLSPWPIASRHLAGGERALEGVRGDQHRGRDAGDRGLSAPVSVILRAWPSTS